MPSLCPIGNPAPLSPHLCSQHKLPTNHRRGRRGRTKREEKKREREREHLADVAWLVYLFGCWLAGSLLVHHIQPPSSSPHPPLRALFTTYLPPPIGGAAAFLAFLVHGVLSLALHRFQQTRVLFLSSAAAVEVLFSRWLMPAMLLFLGTRPAEGF